jgi:hypothetical protein
MVILPIKKAIPIDESGWLAPDITLVQHLRFSAASNLSKAKRKTLFFDFMSFLGRRFPEKHPVVKSEIQVRSALYCNFSAGGASLFLFENSP